LLAAAAAMALSIASAAVGAQQPPPQYVERVEVARVDEVTR
jgi:hypothetical protein